jgi:hypothetical protein
MLKEFWLKYAVPYRSKMKYILIYNLKRDKAFDDYAKLLSKKTGLPFVRLCNAFHQIFQSGKKAYMPTPFEFLGLIQSAEYVLTDSFHATAFSMILETEPVCYLPKRYPGRRRASSRAITIF